MLLRVKIAFLFISFQLLKREREQILLGLDLPQIDLWHEFHGRKASETSFLGRKEAELETKSREVFKPRSKFLKKTKDFFESLKCTWECKQQISVGGAVQKEILSVNMTFLLSF